MVPPGRPPPGRVPLVLQNAGPDPDGFVDFYRRELADAVRKLTPRQ